MYILQKFHGSECQFLKFVVSDGFIQLKLVSVCFHSIEVMLKGVLHHPFWCLIRRRKHFCVQVTVIIFRKYPHKFRKINYFSKYSKYEPGAGNQSVVTYY